MGRIWLYELKKIAKRPFAVVVTVGCLAVLAFATFYGLFFYTSTYAWGPELYGSYENIPPDELQKAHEHGLSGAYEGTVILSGPKALQLDRQRAEAFAGEWDNERLQKLARQYLDYKNNPEIYNNQELDVMSMDIRRWSFEEQGMPPEEIEAYDAANPIYAMKPEHQYGEWQKWGEVSTLLEEYIINPDGTVKSFEEAFPLIDSPAPYAYHAGPRFTAEMQGVLVGIMGVLLLLAGISPIFSDEVANHTEPILLAAKFGRSKLIRAKILAGLLYTVAGLLVLTFFNFLFSGIAYGFSGYSMPIQFDFMRFSMPFALTYWQYLLLLAGMQVLGLCALGGLLMVLSCLFRSAIPVVFTGGLFSVITIIMANQAGEPLRQICQTLPPGLSVPVALLLDGWKSGWNVLPLPQWILAIVVALVVLVTAVLIIITKYRRLRKV